MGEASGRHVLLTAGVELSWWVLCWESFLLFCVLDLLLNLQWMSGAENSGGREGFGNMACQELFFSLFSHRFGTSSATRKSS